MLHKDVFQVKARYMYILVFNLHVFELNVYLFLKTVEQSKFFEHEQIWSSRIGGTTRSLGAWKVKSSYKVHVYQFLCIKHEI